MRKLDYFYVDLPLNQDIDFIKMVRELLDSFGFKVNDIKLYKRYKNGKPIHEAGSLYFYLEEGLIEKEEEMLKFLLMFDKKMEKYETDYCFVPYLNTLWERIENEENISNWISVKPSGKHYSRWTDETYTKVLHLLSELENVELFEYGTYAIIIKDKAEEIKTERTEILIASDNFQQLDNYLKVLEKLGRLDFYRPKFELYYDTKFKL